MPRGYRWLFESRMRSLGSLGEFFFVPGQDSFRRSFIVVFLFLITDSC